MEERKLNKAHLNNSWFKSLNVSIHSEGKARKLAHDIRGEDPVAEMGYPHIHSGQG